MGGREVKLPKILFVSLQNTGSQDKDDEYFQATEDAADHATAGEVEKVGRYELVEVGTVTAEPMFVPDKRKPR
jgi:hypothetical protein